MSGANMVSKGLVLITGLALAWSGGTGCGFSTPSNPLGDGGGIDAAGPPTVGFVVPTTLEDESSGAIEIAVRLSFPAPALITVPYSIVGGTAAEGADYTGAGGTLTFAPGDAEAAIVLTILPDGAEEENETIELALGTPVGDALLGAKNHTVTISADILPRVNFSLGSSSRDENQGETLNVVLDRSPAVAITLAYTVTGSATHPTDHALTSGTLTFPINEITQTLELPVLDDALDEDPETVIVTLQSPTNVVLGTTIVRTHTITDNDPMPTVSFAQAAASRGEATGPMTVTVTLSAISGRAVTVPFAVAGASTASADDYALPTALSLTIPAGMSSASFSVDLTSDALDEDDEQLVLQLQAPTNATVGAIGAHTLTITDDDNPPVVQWDPAQANGSSVEDGQVRVFDYDVVLDAPSGRTVTVSVATGGGTAQSPMDFTVVSGIPVVFAPGTTRRTVRIEIVDDDTAENGQDEVIQLVLSATPTNATRGANDTRTHAIEDDD